MDAKVCRVVDQEGMGWQGAFVDFSIVRALTFLIEYRLILPFYPFVTLLPLLPLLRNFLTSPRDMQ